MSDDFNSGIETAALEIDAHARAHERIAEQFRDERPVTAEDIMAIARDLDKLAAKIRRMKR